MNYNIKSSSPSQFSLFYLLAFALVVCGVFIYNLRPPSTAPKQKKSAELQDESHRKKDDLSSIEGEGLLETKSIEMSSDRRTHSASVGGLYGSIEEQPSNPPKSSQP